MAFRELMVGRIVYIRNSTVLYRVGSGVSTYSGGDVDKRTITEPVKIAGWALTATSQMLADLEFAGAGSEALRDKLRARIWYWQKVHQINARPFNFGSILELLRAGELDRRAIRAFLRRNSPAALRSVYSRATAKKV